MIRLDFPLSSGQVFLRYNAYNVFFCRFILYGFTGATAHFQWRQLRARASALRGFGFSSFHVVTGNESRRDSSFDVFLFSLGSRRISEAIFFFMAGENFGENTVHFRWLGSREDSKLEILMESIRIFIY